MRVEASTSALFFLWLKGPKSFRSFKGEMSVY